MNLWVYVSAVCLCGWKLLAFVEGKLLCECSTIDCQIERRKSCEADHFCYVENINSVLTRGCINDKTPLLCENRKPSKLPSGHYEEWPFLFCCKDEDYCNREIVPVKPTEEVTVTQVNIIPDEKYNPYVREEFDDSNTPCPNSSSSDSSKLNPIYIAVPVAGVCVLLALIIFAMYLLRRRNDLYANYEAYQYHEQIAKIQNNKQSETKSTSCNGTLNRCTDSERSSQGSETKLFLNA